MSAPPREESPGGNSGLSGGLGKDLGTTLAVVVAGLRDLGPFTRRVLQDCLQQADAQYWAGRARAFEAARHGGYVYQRDIRLHKKACVWSFAFTGDRSSAKPCECPVIHHKGERKVDSPGKSTQAELQARIAELSAIAKACHNRSTLAALDTVEVAALLQEVAA